MIICISGTPGTGKTYLAEKIVLASKKRFERLDLNRLIKENRLYSDYDKKAKTYDVDIKTMVKAVTPMLNNNHSRTKAMDRLVNKTLTYREFIKKMNEMSKKSKDHGFEGIIVDSHLSHYLKCDYCVVVRSDLKKLNKRLKERRYPKKKIEDNLQSEIFEICLQEAKDAKQSIITVDN